MSAAKKILSLFAQLAPDHPAKTARPPGRGLPPRNLSPAERIQPATLDRRAFFLAIGASVVAASPAVARLTSILPNGDTWRFGWIVPEDNRGWKVYYGLDTANPEALVSYLARGDELIAVTLQELEDAFYQEAAAEIKISQGHAGLKATGGLRMLPGDEEDFDEIIPDEQVTMIDGMTSDEDVENTVQRLARGRDATPEEMAHAATPKYRFVTGRSEPPYGILFDVMVDEETYGKLDAIVAEQWPLTEDQILRMEALVS